MNIPNNNSCQYCSNNTTYKSFHQENYESALNNHLDSGQSYIKGVQKSDFNIHLNSPNNHQGYYRETNVHYKSNNMNSKDQMGGMNDRRVLADKDNHMSDMNHKTLHSSMGSFRQSNTSHSKPVYETITFQRNLGNYQSKKKQDNTVTLEHFVSPSIQRSLNKKKALIPMLKTNKAYDISFTLDPGPGGNENYNSLSKSKESKINFIEYTPRNHSQDQLSSSCNHLMTNNKLLQTGESLQKRSMHSLTHSNGIINDISGHGHAGNSRSEYNHGAEKTVYTKEELIEKKQNKNENMSTIIETSHITGGHHENGHQDYVDHNTMKATESVYSYKTTKGSLHNPEVNEVKERMIIEFPDGHHEKRDFRKEFNEEGDVNFIDVENGLLLKTEKASWKSGEEYTNKSGQKRIRYEWRKDADQNQWVKYNAETNEKLRSGDWKSGSEWIKNSDGKIVKRDYIYTKDDIGQLIKSYLPNANSNSNSNFHSNSNMLSFSTSSALHEHEWIPTLNNKKCKKFEDKRWERRVYTYEKNNKGKWEKIDLDTRKKISKTTKSDWKRGVDYHMDSNGKVTKVKYVWEAKEGELMEKLNQKTKLPINSTWKEGKETTVTGDTRVTHCFAWVKIGNNKWVKVDKETGVPLTKKLKSSQISSHLLSNQKNQEKKSK